MFRKTKKKSLSCVHVPYKSETCNYEISRRSCARAAEKFTCEKSVRYVQSCCLANLLIKHFCTLQFLLPSLSSPLLNLPLSEENVLPFILCNFFTIRV